MNAPRIDRATARHMMLCAEATSAANANAALTDGGILGAISFENGWLRSKLLALCAEVECTKPPVHDDSVLTVPVCGRDVWVRVESEDDEAPAEVVEVWFAGRWELREQFSEHMLTDIDRAWHALRPAQEERQRDDMVLANAGAY